MLLLLVFFALSAFHRAHLHLTYPLNHCNMAVTCIHDNRMVCASTPDGCSRRSFLDQCDMYEYNCDYGTSYQETYLLLCSRKPIHEDLLHTGTERATTTTPHICPTPVTTSSITTNTPITCPSIPTATIPSTITSSKNSPTTTTTEVSVNTAFTGCCDRPVTWETVTEADKVVAYIEKDSILELIGNDQTSEEELRNEIVPQSTTSSTSTSSRFTTIPSTSIPTTSTTSTIISLTSISSTSEITTSPFTTYSSTTPVTSSEANFSPVTEVAVDVFTGCCDMPIWETYAKVDKVVTYFDIDSTIDYIQSATEPTIVDFQTTETTTVKPTTTIITKLLTTTTKPTTSELTTTETTTGVLPTEPATISYEREITVTNNLKNSTNCFAVSCQASDTNSVNITKCCNRPKTWETTEETPMTISDIIEETTVDDITESKKFTTVSIIGNKKSTSTYYHNSDTAEVIFIKTTPSSQSSETPSTAKKLPETTYPTTQRRTTKLRTTTTETSSPEEFTATLSRNTEKDVLTLKIKTEPTHAAYKPTTWWYPQRCRSKNCNRPMTWETTKRRNRRKYR